MFWFEICIVFCILGIISACCTWGYFKISSNITDKYNIIFASLTIVFVLLACGFGFLSSYATRFGLYSGDYSEHTCDGYMSSCDKPADGGARFMNGEAEEYFCKEHYSEAVIGYRDAERRVKQKEKAKDEWIQRNYGNGKMDDINDAINNYGY